MIIIGELINATRKKVKEAVTCRNASYIRELARKQEEAGAHYIDVNVATDSGDLSRETEDMRWAVKEVMQGVSIPLSIDTTNPEALKAGLEICGRGTFINSITGEEDRLEPFLELSAAYDSLAVVLPIRDGIPATAEERLKICAEITEKSKAAGIAPGKLFFDPLIFPLGVDDSSGATALETLRGIKQMEGVKTTLGLSNISFGLPRRDLLNLTFLTMAMQLGLDSAILNPLQKGLTAALLAGEAILGKDRMCLQYIKGYRRGLLD